MSTASTAAARPVEITDATLLNFHNQRQIAYTGTKKQFQDSLPILTQSTEAIVAFKTQVRERGKVLQEERVKVPSQEELEREKETFLSEYQKYKATYEKAGLLAENILGTIGFLTPVQRTYSQENSLKTESPELYAQTKRSEEICLGHINELKDAHAQVTGLREKLLTSINDSTLTWSLQRFCGIVDNQGKPLGWTTRATNFVTPYLVIPTIPKPKGLTEGVSTSMETGVVGSDSKPVDPLQSGSSSSNPEKEVLTEVGGTSSRLTGGNQVLLPSSDGGNVLSTGPLPVPSSVVATPLEASRQTDADLSGKGKKEELTDEKKPILTGAEEQKPLNRNQRRRLSRKLKTAAATTETTEDSD
ncbi:MAG: hypothetical protein JSS60_05790 [Verrucomicrobia bacterium]|nr:hypothetical protein [Verrucomicrobiota bacterium]